MTETVAFSQCVNIHVKHIILSAHGTRADVMAQKHPLFDVIRDAHIRLCIKRIRTLEKTRLTPYLLACLVWGIVNAAPVPHPTDGLTARRENYISELACCAHSQ